MQTYKEIQQAMQGATSIPTEVMDYVYEQRWLQIWVPKQYGGLGYDFGTGLAQLYQWAQLDGSLGWMLTLCAGANYFSRNLEPATAQTLFANSRTCFGGSGMLGGTAELKSNGSYVINGQWTYATGAPYLSHFTLNATVTEKGNPVLDEAGQPVVQSFIVEAKDVEVLADWKSMGMRATGTYSFRVDHVMVPATHTFVYNQFYCDDTVNKIPFRIFADLTLLVNYLGIAQHYVAQAQTLLHTYDLSAYTTYIEAAFDQTLSNANQVEVALLNGETDLPDLQDCIHRHGVEVVRYLSHAIIDLHAQLGIKGTQTDQPIYQIFTDFFTATMHKNFRVSL